MDSVNALPDRVAQKDARPRPSAARHDLRRVSVTIRAGMMPWVPFWMAIGIGGWFALPDEPGASFYWALMLSGCALVLAMMLVPRLAARGLCRWEVADRSRVMAMALLLVVLGAGLAGMRSHLVAAPVLDFRYYGPVEGRVLGIDRSSRDRMRLMLDQVQLHDVAPWKVPRRVRISLLNDAALPVPGQRVMLTAHLSPPGGPSEPGAFDFRRLAWFQGLGAIGYARTPIMTVAMPQDDGALALHRLRMSMAQSIRDRIGGQAGAVSAALVTGDRSGISEQTNEIMRASNLYHIISISGLHMSMLAGFVYAALRLAGTAVQALGGMRIVPVHKMAAMGALTVAALYLWLSGGGVATERAFIMVAVMLLAIVADRRAVSLRTVAVAATLVLILGPEALTEPGFQMSFAATVALILVQEPWLKVAPRLPWWIKPVLMLLVSSLVASLATSPIAAVHFGRMTQYGLLANLLVVPMVGLLVMPGAVFAAVLAPLGLAQPALWVMGLGTDWMLLVAGWIASLDGAVTYLPAPPQAVLPLLGVGAVFLFIAGSGDGTGVVQRLRRCFGAVMLAGAAGLWMHAERPEVLISAEGDAVAVLTMSGRVPSKAKGGSFSVQNWLEADGDNADQATAAERTLWQGPASDRRARLPSSGLVIRHITGKAARLSDVGFCEDIDIVVSNEPLRRAGAAGQDCLILDRNLLRQRGSVALLIRGDRILAGYAEPEGRGRIWH